MAEADTLAPLGHNRTLADQFAELNAQIPEYLASQFTHLAEQADALRSEFTISVPSSINDDGTEKAMTDLGVRINGFLKACGNEKKITKDLPAKAPKLIDSFFDGLSATLTTNMETLRSRVNVYKNQKAEAERQRLAAERERALAAQREADEKAREAERLRAEASRILAASASSESAEPTPEELLAQEAERAAIKSQAEAILVRSTTPAIAPMIKAESGAKSGQIGKWVAKDIDRDVIDLEALRSFFTMADLERYACMYARQYKDTKPLAGARIIQEFNTQFRS